MRYLKYICLLLLPWLWSCDDERFAAEFALQNGPIKYLFVAEIDSTTIESRVALEPLDHGHDVGHYHDLALHWEEGDIVTLKDDNKTYDFKAEKMVVDDKSIIVFTYRGQESIDNAANFTGKGIYTPSNSTTDAHQSANSNSDHLKDYGPSLIATLSNVNLTNTTGNAWLESGDFIPIRFHPDSNNSEYAYFKIEVSGFKYPIWGGGSVWIYLLEEDCIDYNDHHTPWAKITFGTAPENMVNISGGENVVAQSAKYIWPNLKEQDPTFCLGNQKTDFYDTQGGYPVFNDDGTKKISRSEYTSVSFPNTLTETPFINVPEYWIITPTTDTKATGYNSTMNTTPANFDPISQYYNLSDIIGNFYVPVTKKYIEGKTKGNLYIATVLQCGWSGDLYVWEKKVPENINIEAGKLYVLDYSKHKPEFAVKFAKNTYFRSTFLEQNLDNTKTPRYTLLGEKVGLGDRADNPNRIVRQGLMTGNDVKKMIINHGAFMHEATPICAIYPGTKKVVWEMKNDTAFEKETINGDTHLKAMKVFLDNNNTTTIPYYSTATQDGLFKNDEKNYNTDGGVWDKIINRPDVIAPENYLNKTKEYMQKIAKGIMNPASENFIGRYFYNCIEFVLLNKFDPVMNSTKTCNLWRAPYGADINALCNYSESVFFTTSDKKYLIIESTKSGHRICLPNIKCYSNSYTKRGTNTDGTGKDVGTGNWKEANTTEVHFISCRSVRSFGSNNPAYMQALDLSCGTIAGGKIGKFLLATKFDLAYPVLPVFRWELPVDSNEGVLEW